MTGDVFAQIATALHFITYELAVLAGILFALAVIVAIRGGRR